MSSQAKTETLFGGYRALDLTDEKGFLCGRLLADLGTDVIKVESPGGDPARNIGPFYHDIPEPEKSLYWFAFNANKRGITLNLECADGQEIFRKLVKNIDVVIESFAPGYMDGLGLGYEALTKTNNAIIMVSITPFGQSGPYRDYQAPDLVATAMSGYMSVCGDRDRAPVRIGFPQAYLHASADAAAGVVTALYYKGMTGEGQYIDVSAQASMLFAMMDAPATWELLKENVERVGSQRTRPGTKFSAPAILECQDGYLYFALYGGLVGARGNQALINWMDSEGLATDFVKGIDWSKFDLYRPEVDQDYVNGIMEPVAKFFKSHTKRELLEEGLKRHIMLFPLSTTKDIVESPQLAAREYWVSLEHPELEDTITCPGPFVKLSSAPCQIRRRAPLIGEHNEEIYIKGLGLSREELLSLKQIGAI